MFRFFLLGVVSRICAESLFYDTFSGNVLSNDEVKVRIKKNITFWCVNEVLPCDPLERRRVDGSCNNLKHPSMGTIHSRPYRLLPAEYDKDYEPRKSNSGEPLPLSRSVRTTLVAEGQVPDSKFTQLVGDFWLHAVADVLSLHDTVNFLIWTTYCCEEKGKTRKECIPNIVPDDDPVHRFSSIRCLNQTRPLSFQSVGCLKNDTVPERVVTATVYFDLSHIYGNSLKELNAKGRLFEKGLLKYEVENGKIWPPSITIKQKEVCLMNQLPHETRCHDTPNLSVNGVVGTNIFMIWTWRFHNRVANVLSKLNKCWNDDRIFFTARDITIATSMQIFLYELMPTLMGYDNLVKEGVILSHKGFRDIYDEHVLPQISLEFPTVLRWAHMIQVGKQKMYDTKGNYLKQHQAANLTLRTGYLVDNIDYITQGVFRQPSGGFDYIVDPDIAELGLGDLQRAFDLLTNDLTKGRYLGLPPYIKYRQLCSGNIYSTFEDLLDVIDPQRIELLKEKYKHVEDIDLMAGIWLERPVKDGFVPVTLYCVVVEQLRRSVVSDRHWYERPNRPNAFTPEQLLEIRKTSVAQFLCSVGDSVTEIQPHAFLLPGPGNEIRSCSEIEKINLEVWKDRNCDMELRNESNSQF
ncbi:unnamed protein product [Euphydryas editha]|uniref:Peroxidase n=1 Tax=Euphydryas editha TaxID=104508 RepID=A0AAU9V844_EUPED|nr:unnamed protein product [Euphydryas editha]